MNRFFSGASRPSATGMVAGTLVIAGVLLFMMVSKAFLILSGLGAFGPGILRELGWLNDQDEFQRESTYRAGYHAYLIGGLAAIVIVSVVAWKGGIEDDAAEWVRLILVTLWLSWMFSSLLAFWGAKKTATRVLWTFGSFWALFAILTLIGEASDHQDIMQTLQGLLAGLAIVSPFFILGWSASRWPGITGMILLAVAVGLFILLFPNGNLNLSTTLLTYAMLLIPIVGSGIALLRFKGEEDESESSAA